MYIYIFSVFFEGQDQKNARNLFVMPPNDQLWGEISLKFDQVTLSALSKIDQNPLYSAQKIRYS